MRRDESEDELESDDDPFGDSWFDSPGIRRPEKFSPDPAVWLAEHRMTQTEVGLRLSAHLLRTGIAANHVILHLAGYELTRRENPRFPARRYLIERLGFTTDIADALEWRGSYYMNGRPHALVLNWDKHAGHVATFLASGQRLVVFVTAGLLRESRSPAEHTKFWQVVGRAITSPLTDATDLVAVCVPRSERYRKLASQFRQAEGIIRSRLGVLTVDRTGYVDGLQSLVGD